MRRRTRQLGGAGGAIALAGLLGALTVPVAAFASGKTAPKLPSHQATDATRIALLAGLAVIAAIALCFWKLVIGEDGRTSTSRTTAFVWTCLLAGSFLGIVLADLLGHPQALNAMTHSGLAGQYGLLIGGPLGAAIAAKGLVSAQVKDRPDAKPASGDSPTVAQLVQNDAGDADLGDFQYVVFNLVAIVFFVGTLYRTPTAGLPTIPDVLLGLTSVSAVGYSAKKALPNKPGPRPRTS